MTERPVVAPDIGQDAPPGEAVLCLGREQRDPSGTVGLVGFVGVQAGVVRVQRLGERTARFVDAAVSGMVTSERCAGKRCRSQGAAGEPGQDAQRVAATGSFDGAAGARIACERFSNDVA